MGERAQFSAKNRHTSKLLFSFLRKTVLVLPLFSLRFPKSDRLLVRWAMAKAALLADVLPRALSFAGAKRLLHAFADQLRRTSGKQVRIMIATVIASIATLRLPNRPDRIEPRAKKRRPKNLPLLTMPRQVARDLIYAQRELNRVP